MKNESSSLTRVFRSIRPVLLLALGGCASAGLPDRGGASSGAVPARAQAPRNPEQERAQSEYLRQQMVRQSRGVPPGRYTRVLRPAFARQLQAMGLEPGQVAGLLADLDASRAWTSPAPSERADGAVALQPEPPAADPSPPAGGHPVARP